MTAARIRTVLAAAAALLIAAASRPAAAADPPPRRIVSMNLCSDELVLALAPRSSIVGLSWLATDPLLSASAEAARGFPLIRGEAEEVLALEPDLVVTVEHANPIATSLVERLGKRVVKLPLAASFDDVRRSVRVLAAALGVGPRGEAVVAEFDARLAAAAPSPGANPTALAYDVNSLSAGGGTLLAEAIAAAGFDNAAIASVLGPGDRMPLETIVAHPPDLVVLMTPPDEFRTVAADNLRHPALRKVLRSRASLELPMSLTLCGGPELATAVERLAASRGAIVASRTKAGHRPP